METKKQDLLGSAWILVAVFCLSLMSVLVKYSAQRYHISIHELVFWRVLVATVVLGAQAVILQRSWRTRHLKPHLLRSVSGSLGLIFSFYALAHLPLATAVTLNHTSAIFLTLLSIFLLKDRPNWKIHLSLILGLVGIVLLLRPTLHEGQFFSGLIGLISGLMAGYAYFQVRELSLLGEPSWRVVLYFSLFCTLGSGAFITATTGWQGLSWQSAPAVLSMGLVAMLGQLAMTHAYAVGRKFTVAVLSYFSVVFAVIWGVLIWDDSLDWQEILGIMVIVGSGIISGLPDKK